VQKLFDAQGQRGSWMPSIFFRGISQHFPRNFQTFSEKFSLKNFPVPEQKCFILLPKFLTTFLVNISQFSPKFSNLIKTRSLDAPTVDDDAPLTTFFSSFFSHSPTFFYQNSLDASQAGCPGLSHRPHPPLHATGAMCGGGCIIYDQGHTDLISVQRILVTLLPAFFTMTCFAAGDVVLV